MWNGKWPGEEDCERLGFYSNGDPDFPDLNRLFTDCVWDADTGRLGTPTLSDATWRTLGPVKRIGREVRRSGMMVIYHHHTVRVFRGPSPPCRIPFLGKVHSSVPPSQFIGLGGKSGCLGFGDGGIVGFRTQRTDARRHLLILPSLLLPPLLLSFQR